MKKIPFTKATPITEEYDILNVTLGYGSFSQVQLYQVEIEFILILPGGGRGVSTFFFPFFYFFSFFLFRSKIVFGKKQNK